MDAKVEVQPVIKRKVRVPLVRVFGVALSVIFLLFLLISWLTFSRLLSFESTLRNISDEALPDIVLSSQLYGKASNLIEFTQLLTKSGSDVEKRLAETQLEKQIDEIKKISSRQLDNEYVETQLEIINLELMEFSDLITRRLNVRKKLAQNEYQAYQVYSQGFDLPHNVNQNSEVTGWKSHLAKSMLGLNLAINSTRLQEMRYNYTLFRKQLQQLKSLSVNESDKGQKQQLTEALEQLVFKNNGIEASTISLLKLSGRVIGRESFIHNLIKDFTRLLEFSASETKNNIFEQVNESVADAKKQTNLIGLVIALAIAFLLLVVFFIQQRMLKRLRIFNRMVQSKTQGVEYGNLLRGNDEITDLAETFNEFVSTIEMQKKKLEHMSLSDGLTGIANRRALDIRLLHDIELSIRQKSSVCVILMDVDCFKLYNDNYGHSAGDECLKSIARVIGNSLQRDSDFIARFGGEEFICVLPNTNISGAEDISKHIMKTLENLAIPHKYSKVTDHITLSIGIAISCPDQVLMPDNIIKLADRALYAAKHSGRNRYVIYSADLKMNEQAS